MTPIISAPNEQQNTEPGRQRLELLARRLPVRGRYELAQKLRISLVEFGRDMETVFGTSNGIRTIVFPNTVKIIRQGSFDKVKMLRSAILNEGLEALGREELFQVSVFQGRVFMSDALESVIIQSTLSAVEPSVFEECRDVKMVGFLEGRKTLGGNGEDAGVWNEIFRDSRAEGVVFPGTLREMPPNVFGDCSSPGSCGWRRAVRSTSGGSWARTWRSSASERGFGGARRVCLACECDFLDSRPKAVIVSNA